MNKLTWKREISDGCRILKSDNFEIVELYEPIPSPDPKDATVEWVHSLHKEVKRMNKTHKFQLNQNGYFRGTGSIVDLKKFAEQLAIV